MIRPPPQWHSEAKLLRASGARPCAIAENVGKSLNAVLWVLDEHGERDATRNHVRECRLRARVRARRDTDKPQQTCAKALQARRISRETIDQAVRDFSNHKIDRATLMARITPGGRA